MSSQQQITKFVDVQSRKGNSVLSLTSTPLCNKRVRCSSSPENQETEFQETGCEAGKSNMAAVEVNLEMIFNEILELRKETKELKKETQELKKETQEYKQAVEFIGIKFDEMNKSIADLKAENNSLKTLCEDLKNERKLHAEKVEKLERAMDDQEQYSRRLNVLFDDIDESKQNLAQEVIERCKLINVDLHESDIEIVHRIGKKQQDRNRPVIVRLTSMASRNKIMISMRSLLHDLRKKKKSLSDLPRIREHLTPLRASLYKEARELQIQRKWTSCFVRDGTILVQRLNPPGPPDVVRSVQDMARLKRL